MSQNNTDQDKPAALSFPKKSIEDGIGIRLKAAREGKGISQTDLHRLTGLSRTVLINYEAGRHIPGVRELRLLCDALGVTPNSLIYGTEEPIPKSEGLADSILAMGAGGAAAIIMLGPMLPAALGKDDTRLVLTMIESLLKAKDQEGFALIMDVINSMKSISESAAMKDPKKMEALFEGYPEAIDRLHAYQKLLHEIQERAEKQQ